ncbi:MAG: lipopolysaccharide kinase InaA family protein [Halobacteriota archaeon]|nr:lipopolysaccharide kinase InaA family protein [Halobacteriota archaeon]
MPWVSINSCSGISKDFNTLPTPEQKRLLPNCSLPVNVLNIEDLYRILNEDPKICHGEGEKKPIMIEGYYPPKFGVWPTHKLYKITYEVQGVERHTIAKIMNRRYGTKEFSLLSDLHKFMDVPEPLHFMYDDSFEDEFLDAFGIFWMSYIGENIRFEESLLEWCMGERRDKLELEGIRKLLTTLWSAGVKHNDLKGEHLLLNEEKWYIIDFEKSIPFKGEDDIKDELSVFIGDCSVYIDRFVDYSNIVFEGDIRRRYEVFLYKILDCFNVDIIENRYLSLFTNSIKNKDIRSSIYTCISSF